MATRHARLLLRHESLCVLPAAFPMLLLLSSMPRWKLKTSSDSLCHFYRSVFGWESNSLFNIHPSIQCVLRLSIWKGRNSWMSRILCESAADNRQNFDYFEGFSIRFSLLHLIDGNIPFGIWTRIFIFRISNVGNSILLLVCAECQFPNNDKSPNIDVLRINILRAAPQWMIVLLFFCLPFFSLCFCMPNP